MWRGTKENKIPADVIHFDTGWFETDWQCDYVFAQSFFEPRKMIKRLTVDGFIFRCGSFLFPLKIAISMK